jgi:hypothetical protein
MNEVGVGGVARYLSYVRLYVMYPRQWAMRVWLQSTGVGYVCMYVVCVAAQ